MSRNSGSSTQTQDENLRPIEIELDGTQNNCRCESCQYQGRRRQVNSVNWLSEDGKQTPWHNVLKSPTSDNDATNNAIAPNTLETSSGAASSTLGKASTCTDFTIDTNITEPAITTSTNLTVPGVICSQKEVSTASTTSHCPIEPASTKSDGPETQEELVNCSIPLPGSRDKKIWHFQAVCSQVVSPEDYNSRFTYVVHELKKAVDEHDTLRDRARFIDYDLRMVGTSLQAAKPSIIVKCNRKDVTSLRSLFKHTAGLRLCSPGEISIRSRLFHDSVRSRNAMFQLYYFPSNSNPTVYMVGEEANIIKVPSTSTMCGALVQHQGLFATIGLTLDIDGMDRLLTVNHLFRHDILEEQAKSKIDDLPLPFPFLGGDEDSTFSDQDEADPWFNDSDDDDEKQTGEDRGRMELKFQQDIANAVSEDAIWGQQFSSSEPNEQAAKSGTTDYSSPYLDWACLRTRDDDSIGSMRCNYLILDKNSRTLLQTVSRSPRVYATPVYLISAIRGVRCGTLIAARGYLGSFPGQALCQVWTVVMDGGIGIVPGECGSVVVDRETFGVYGHVVGSDMLGHARVVPLSIVIDQIKAEFNAKSIQLPTTAQYEYTTHPCETQWLSQYPMSQPEHSTYDSRFWMRPSDLGFIRPWRDNGDTLGLQSDTMWHRFPAIVSHSHYTPQTNSSSSNCDSEVCMSSEDAAGRPESVSDYSIADQHVLPTDVTNWSSSGGKPLAASKDRQGRWACPFAKKSGLSSHPCYKRAFNDIPRVKQHLRREHYHIDGNGISPEHLTAEQCEKMRRRMPTNDIQSWTKLFHILFPEDKLPNDPFVPSCPGTCHGQGPNDAYNIQSEYEPQHWNKLTGGSSVPTLTNAYASLPELENCESEAFISLAGSRFNRDDETGK